MALPKRRHSHSRTRTRRAHDALTAPNLVSCDKCGEAKLSHRLCGNCGSYKGRDVLHLEEVAS